MNKTTLSNQIDALLRKSQWKKARKLLETELARTPQDHWVLTQLGVTFYEEKNYDAALRLFLKALKIVPDCPLALWNLAGTLDAMGKPSDALKIYSWLLRTNRSPEDDPCWESKEWTDALKTDSLYRLGVCFEHLGETKKAEDCDRQYLNLLLVGGEGTYSADDVTGKIRELHRTDERKAIAGAMQKAKTSALRSAGGQSKGNSPPIFDAQDLIAGHAETKSAE